MFRCPKCASTKLEVVVEVWAKLIQTVHPDEPDDPNFEINIDAALDHDHEWTGNSPMHCMNCGHFDITDEFKTKELPSDAEEESDLERARR